MKLRNARLITLGGYFGLMTLVVVWHAWLYPPRHFPTALALTALPLLLPLRGLLQGRIRSYLWVCLLMMLYLMHGVVETLTNPPQQLLAVLEITLGLTVFIGAALCARWAPAAEKPGP